MGIVYGVGLYERGEFVAYKDGKHTREYIAWKEMLRRCYSENFQKKRQTYTGCTVCDEWLIFQNFAKWYSENLINDAFMYLDKDIKIKNNKEYSPESCLLVDKAINSLFVYKKTNLLRGVSLGKGGVKYIAQCWGENKKRQEWLGTYDTEYEAFLAYKEFKEKHIKKIAIEYMEKYGEEFNDIYDAMCNYTI